MATPIHGIALRTVRHNERNDILTLYTAESGRMSVIVSAGTSAASRRRRALTMPLSLVECVVMDRPGRNLNPIRDLRPTLPLPGLHTDPRRMSVAMFTAETLWHILPEGDADKSLWRFLADAVTFLDATPDSVANFHLALLMGIGHYLGIAPYGPRALARSRRCRRPALIATHHPDQQPPVRNDTCRTPTRPRPYTSILLHALRPAVTPEVARHTSQRDPVRAIRKSFHNRVLIHMRAFFNLFQFNAVYNHKFRFQTIVSHFHFYNITSSSVTPGNLKLMVYC